MITQILLSYSKGVQIFYIYLILVNLTGFGLMSIDKYKAKKGKLRIQELTFIFIAFIGGSIGILFAMVIFKHKISKKNFSIGIPILYIFNVIANHVIIYYIINWKRYRTYYFNYIKKIEEYIIL